jgi:hypothetical protein
MAELYGENWGVVLFVSFLMTWGIGLTPPLLIRYVFVKRPISRGPAIALVVAFWFFNFLLFTALGSQSKTHSALLLVALVSYFILTKGATRKNKGKDTLRKTNEGKKAHVKPQHPKVESSNSARTVLEEDGEGSISQIRDLYKNAFVAMEYRPDAKAAFDKLGNIPRRFKIRYLELLEQNPKGSVNDYLKTVQTEHAKWHKPYKDNRINLVLQEARKLGPEAENEFTKVMELLGDSADPIEILKRVKMKYGSVRTGNEQRTSFDALGNLLSKYKCDSEELMRVLDIKHDLGRYVYKEKRYDSFVEAAIVADRDNISI